jgi:competence/damage-inducible protein CinA-like protein
MSIEVLAVGDELLSGATLETNAQFTARELFDLGLRIERITVVGDEAAALRDALASALERCTTLIVTGGLGPTIDDRTKEVAAEYFGDPLDLDAEILESIRRRFEARGRPMPEINRKQALVPRSARIIPNPVGSAPGVHWNRDGKDVFLLPGVPAEMQAMLRESLLPRLAERYPARGLRAAAFRTCGIAESELAERLQPITDREADVTWAFYPSWGGVDLKLSRTGGSEASWSALCNELRQSIGHSLYSESADETLAEVVQRLLLQRGSTLAVAESCTGGMVSARITDVAGSSAIFAGGFVPYANQAKTAWLGVPEELLALYGAVSAEVAAAMARAARSRASADLGISVTGIAGPTGGTVEKPVGLVFLGLASESGSWTRRLQLWTRRDMNRAVSSQLALDMVRRHLSNLPVGDPA